jgi:crotonobetainyl-CoA:carnitine CoA-transferase CaiB-like acyl-CoA transferase
VVDLSSLWAGPLCSHLLQLAGARVSKVESRTRPDAAREGTPLHFARLNAGKEQRSMDLRAERGELLRLLDAADVVIESARPRALQQLGIDAMEYVAERPGKLWISITGYGRGDPAGQWVAFGDDAAAAAGAVRWTAEGPEFVGDAIADPLTGLHAALAATKCLTQGVGGLLELSLAGVTAHCLAG